MISVQKSDFDISKEIDKLVAGKKGIGGVSSFVGLVRDFAKEDKIVHMKLEHYPGMTEKALTEIETEAYNRWSLDGISIIHRYGLLFPGDRIVFVCVASGHRNEAIEACNFLIDWLKTKAPFWKYEKTLTGGQWVESKISDEQATLKWGK